MWLAAVCTPIRLNPRVRRRSLSTLGCDLPMGLTMDGKRKSYRDMKHYRSRKRWLG